MKNSTLSIESVVAKIESLSRELEELKEQLLALSASSSPLESSVETPQEQASEVEMEPLKAPDLSLFVPLTEPAGLDRFEPLHASRRERPISSYISVVDEFRYLNELFMGSREEMRSLLEAASRLSDVTALKEYMTGSLGFDPSCVALKDFIEQVTPYYEQP